LLLFFFCLTRMWFMRNGKIYQSEDEKWLKRHLKVSRWNCISRFFDGKMDGVQLRGEIVSFENNQTMQWSFDVIVIEGFFVDFHTKSFSIGRKMIKLKLFQCNSRKSHQFFSKIMSQQGRNSVLWRFLFEFFYSFTGKYISYASW